MITLTTKQLIEVVASGAYGRFALVRKTIAAGYRNRKTATEMDAELRLFTDARNEIVARFSGALNLSKSDYLFPPDKQGGVDALAELMRQSITISGEPMQIADLLDGGLLESDFEKLAPFLVEP